jgi:hypothetical protein
LVHPAPATDGLLTLRRSAEAADGGAQRRQRDRNLLNLNRLTLASIGRMGACIQQQEPWAHAAADDCFDALAIEPARSFDGVGTTESGDVRVDKAAQPMRYAGGDAGEARSAGDEDNGGVGCAAKCFCGGGV